MAERQVRITLRDKQTTGGSIPSSALLGEPFINLYDGVLKFSGVTGGSFEQSSQSGVFEVGSLLYDQKITNRLSINNSFIISGDTGLISTYGGATGGGLVGKFLSGTSTGFVLSDISSIAGIDSYVTGATWSPNQLSLKLNNNKPDVLVSIETFTSSTIGSLVVTGSSTLNLLQASTISASTGFFSAGTSLESIIYNIASSTENTTNVQPGSNITTGGTTSSPTINLVSSPSINNLSFSGTITGPSLSATTMSGSTLRLSSTAFIGSTSSIQWGDNGMAGSINGFLSMSSDGVFRFGDSLGGGSPRIIMGSAGASTGISLKRSGIGLQIRNGDDSGYASLSASSVVGSSVSATTISATTYYSGSTNLSNLFVNAVNSGTNISVGGSSTQPTVNVIDSPSFAGLISATGFTDSSLTSGRVVYVGASGRLVDESGFEYNSSTDTLSVLRATFGVFGQTGTTLTIHGDMVVMGDAISGFTSQLYIEDNLIELNYNPTASTESTSLGAGWSIQDGSGVAGTDVFLDIRGTGTTVSNRGFATNLNDIYIRESGTTSSPNGVRVIAEGDWLDGGSY